MNFYSEICIPHKRNAEATRARILLAAQEAFSTTGYSGTGIREIANIAGISSALLVRYFGSKAHLFEEALNASLADVDPSEWEESEFGQQLATGLIDPDNKVRTAMMIVLASGDPEAAAIAARATGEHGQNAVAGWLKGEHAHERALATSMMAAGYVIYAGQLPLHPSTDMSKVRQWFVATIDRLVSGEEWAE